MRQAFPALGVLLATSCTQGQTSTETRSPPTSERIAIADARPVFAAWCMPCHGAAGKGDGVTASRLVPAPANLTDSAVQARSQAEIATFVAQGARARGRLGAMPPFGRTLPDYTLSDLAVLIHHLDDPPSPETTK